MTDKPEGDAGELDSPDPTRQLTDQEERLFRHVNPGWVDKGRVGSIAFRPMPKDRGLLSVDRSSLTTPEAAYRLYTESLGLASTGVWAVTVAEVARAGEGEHVSLLAYGDPITEPVENGAHAVVNFRPLGTNAAKRVASLLARNANDRGSVFEPGKRGPEPFPPSPIDPLGK
jgi:hypothetical protein